MFGAKFQKWMEIVRPRKKSNKNKCGKGNVFSTNIPNEYKETACQNETNISNPARRSEVSPIQNHNGRQGWQSPNQEAPITRINHSGSRHIGKQIEKDHTESSHNSSKNQFKNINYLTTAPTNYHQMNEIDENMMQTNSQLTPNSSLNELFDVKSKRLISSSSSSVNSVVTKSLNKPITKPQEQSESKYGKIQAINKYTSKFRSFSKKTCNIDRFNGNSSDDLNVINITSKDSRWSTKSEKVKNIRFDDVNETEANANLYHVDEKVSREVMSGKLFKSPNTGNRKMCRNENEYIYSKTTYPKFTNSLMPPAPQHQSLHNSPNRPGFSVINHVSSPESAYSTGYSTDSSSPHTLDGGASYSPEYYINMRTGTHYFSKGNTIIDTNNNKFKSGLNRIEEKLDEPQFAHKRTESFDLIRNMALFESLKKSDGDRVTQLSNADDSYCLKPNFEQRNPIVRPSEFRTPSPRQRCRIRTNPWLSVTDPMPGWTVQKHCDNSDIVNSSFKEITSEFSYKESQVEIKEESSQQISDSINPLVDFGSNNNTLTNETRNLNEACGSENDFSSDSDQTYCVSDLEASDECDTDDFLDKEYLEKSKIKDNGKIHEAAEKKSKSKSEAKKDLPKKRKKLKRKRSKNWDVGTIRSTVIRNRECRSVGGTPTALRRTESADKRGAPATSLLSNRSNSLTFSEVHTIHNKMLAISESEKALIKADLEADVKYRQLIHEAELILISMKFNANQNEVPKKTVISSPRRILNVPTNKRVEILRNCEVDLKREKLKPTSKLQDPTNAQSIINKRLESLRYETSLSVPSSPKNNRIAPFKTHVTNFIFQNEIELLQKLEPVSQMKPESPIPLQRRFLTPKQEDDSDTQSDSKTGLWRTSCNLEQLKKITVDHESGNRNPPIALFRSVFSNDSIEDQFFPQSEPLKRKIYSRNSTIDKIQRSIDFDTEIPKKALLQKIQSIRKERQDGKFEENNLPELNNTSTSTTKTDDSIKRKLIMKTIEDIKRNLEDQSIELNELRDSDT